MAKRSELTRCPWAQADQFGEYHDAEWGVPIHDDRLLFEFLILEVAQAGLSWSTILKERQNYREAFDQFDPLLVAKYGLNKQASLMANAGIVKHVAGNLISRWTDFLTTDGEKPGRNRDDEFVDSFISRAELLDLWERGWTCLLGTLKSLHADIRVEQKHQSNSTGLGSSP